MDACLFVLFGFLPDAFFMVLFYCFRSESLIKSVFFFILIFQKMQSIFFMCKCQKNYLFESIFFIWNSFENLGIAEQREQC